MGLGRFIARHRRGALWRWLDRMALKYHRAHANLDHDPRTNGEQRVLEVLGRHPRHAVILDVGANVGQWAQMAARHCPHATIHALEVVPATWERLVAACADEPRIRPHPVGLSDRSGTLLLHLPGGESTLASSEGGFVESWHHKSALTRVEGRVVAGDEFLREQGVAEVELLKLDLEGHEPRALKGLAGTLGAGRVRALQFEYGYVNIDTHFLLRDAYRLLEGHGLVVGKVFPTYVDFRPYKRRDEDFYGPNYLAVRASDQALIDALADR